MFSMSSFKNSNFVKCIDNFLDKESFVGLQNTVLNATPYVHAMGKDKKPYGYEHVLFVDHFKNDPLVKQVKNKLFPNEDFKPVEMRFHLRHNQGEPHPHRDGDFDGDEDFFAFLLYVKGERLLYNGTGFYNYEKELSTYVGFVENRAIFFNAGKIFHTDLQTLGKSSWRYSMNIFFQPPWHPGDILPTGGGKSTKS